MLSTEQAEQLLGLLKKYDKFYYLKSITSLDKTSFGNYPGTFVLSQALKGHPYRIKSNEHISIPRTIVFSNFIFHRNFDKDIKELAAQLIMLLSKANFVVKKWNGKEVVDFNCDQNIFDQLDDIAVGTDEQIKQKLDEISLSGVQIAQVYNLDYFEFKKIVKYCNTIGISIFDLSIYYKLCNYAEIDQFNIRELAPFNAIPPGFFAWIKDKAFALKCEFNQQLTPSDIEFNQRTMSYLKSIVNLCGNNIEEFILENVYDNSLFDLLYHLPNLQRLTFIENDGDTNPSNSINVPSLNIAPKFKHLIEISISSSRLTGKILASILNNANQITSLRLYNCKNIDNFTLQDIVENALFENLTCISCAGSAIRGDVIAKILSLSPNANYLNLSRCANLNSLNIRKHNLEKIINNVSPIDLQDAKNIPFDEYFYLLKYYNNEIDLASLDLDCEFDVNNISVSDLKTVRHLYIGNHPKMGMLLAKILPYSRHLTSIESKEQKNDKNDKAENLTPCIVSEDIPNNLKLELYKLDLTNINISGAAIAKLLNSQDHNIRELNLTGCRTCSDLTVEGANNAKLNYLRDFTCANSNLPILFKIYFKAQSKGNVNHTVTPCKIITHDTYLTNDAINKIDICADKDGIKYAFAKMTEDTSEGSFHLFDQTIIIDALTDLMPGVENIEVTNVDVPQKIIEKLICLSPNLRCLYLTKYYKKCEIDDHTSIQDNILFNKLVDIDCRTKYGYISHQFLFDLIMMSANLINIKLSYIDFCKLNLSALDNQNVAYKKIECINLSKSKIPIKFLIKLIQFSPGAVELALDNCKIIDDLDLLKNSDNLRMAFKNLKSIDLEGTKISLKSFAKLLQYAESLTKLSLDNCKIIEGDGDDCDFNDIIANFDSLTEIKIIKSDIDANLIYTLLKKSKNLTALKVHSKKMNNSYKFILYSRLEGLDLKNVALNKDFIDKDCNLSQLKELTLKNCKGTRYFAMKENHRSPLTLLKELELNNTDADDNIVKYFLLGAKDLQRIILKNCRNLKTIDIGDASDNKLLMSNSLTNVDIASVRHPILISAQTLKWFFTCNPTLKYLEFSYCNLQHLNALLFDGFQIKDLYDLSIVNSLIDYISLVMIIKNAPNLKFLSIASILSKQFPGELFINLLSSIFKLHVLKVKNVLITDITPDKIPSDLQLPELSGVTFLNTGLTSEVVLKLKSIMPNLQWCDTDITPTKKLSNTKNSKEDSPALPDEQSELKPPEPINNSPVTHVNPQAVNVNINSSDMSSSDSSSSSSSSSGSDTSVSLSDSSDDETISDPSSATNQIGDELTTASESSSNKSSDQNNSAKDQPSDQDEDLSLNPSLPTQNEHHNDNPDEQSSNSSNNSSSQNTASPQPSIICVDKNLEEKNDDDNVRAVKEIFIPKYYKPATYRRIVFYNIDTSGQEVTYIPHDINETDLIDVEYNHFTVALRNHYKKNYYKPGAKQDYALGEWDECVLSPKGTRLPSLFPHEKLLFFYIAYKNKRGGIDIKCEDIELKYDKKDNFYIIKARNPKLNTDKPFIVNYILDIKEAIELNQRKVFPSTIQSHIDYCSEFKKRKLEILSNANSEQILIAREQQRTGSCMMRSLVLMRRLKNLFSTKEYENHCVRIRRYPGLHANIEIFDGQFWYMRDLGGYPTKTAIQEIEDKDFEDSRYLPPEPKMNDVPSNNNHANKKPIIEPISKEPDQLDEDQSQHQQQNPQSVNNSEKTLSEHLTMQIEPMVQDQESHKEQQLESDSPIIENMDVTESDLYPTFIAWSSDQLTTPESIEKLYEEINVTGKNTLILFEKPEDSIAALAEIAKINKQPAFYIYSPDDLQWQAPGFRVKQQTSRTNYTLGINEHFSKLSYFLEQNPTGKIFINWMNFTATDIVALHSILERYLEGKAFPKEPPIISLYSENIKNAYKESDFNTRHNLIIQWNFKVITDLFHGRRCAYQTQQEINKDILTIDLYESDDWESLLFGGIHQAICPDSGENQSGGNKSHKQFYVKFTEFATKLIEDSANLIEGSSKLTELHLKNAPWHLKEFQMFWQQTLQQGCFSIYGKTFKLDENFKLYYSSSDEIAKDVIKQQQLLIKPFVYPFNTHTFQEFFTHFSHRENSYEEQQGFISDYKGKQISLVVTETMSLNQWRQLLIEADKCQVQISISLTQGATLPDKMSDVIHDKYDTPSNTVNFYQETLELNNNHFVIITAQQASSAITDELLKLNPGALYIDLDATHHFGDIIYQIISSINQDTIHGELIVSDIWTALLRDGKTVIIEGKLPDSLINALSVTFLNGTAEINIEGQKNGYKGKLIFVTPTNVSYAKNRFVYDKSHHEFTALVQSSSNNHQLIEIKNLNKTLAPVNSEKLTFPRNADDSDSLSITAYKNYKTRRINNILQGFLDKPIISLTGSTGLGKSTYILREFCKDYYLKTKREAKLYIGLSQIEAYTKHNNAQVDPFLVIDEAKMVNEKLSPFKGHYSKIKHHLRNGHYAFLSPRHRMILIDNGFAYGGERQQQEFFIEYTQEVRYEKPNQAYFYHEFIKPQLDKKTFYDEHHHQSKCLISESEHEHIARIILSLYNKVNSLGNKEETILSPRHLKMMGILFVKYLTDREHFDNISKENLAIGACLVIIRDILMADDHQRLLNYLVSTYQFDELAFNQYQSVIIEQKINKLKKPSNNHFCFTPSRFPLLKIIDDLISLSEKGNIDFGLMLIGDSGIGKSELIKNYLDYIKCDNISFSRGPNFDTDKQKLTHAFHQGKKVIFDEIDAGGSRYERLMNTFMLGHDEDNKKAEKNGSMYFPTKNSSALDGRETLPPSMRSRFICKKLGPYPRNELEMILRNFKIEPEAAKIWVTAFLVTLGYAIYHGKKAKPNLRNLKNAVGVDDKGVFIQTAEVRQKNLELAKQKLQKIIEIYPDIHTNFDPYNPAHLERLFSKISHQQANILNNQQQGLNQASVLSSAAPHAQSANDPMLLIRQILENDKFWAIQTYGPRCKKPVGIEYMLEKMKNNQNISRGDLQNIARGRLANNGWTFFSSLFCRSEATLSFYEILNSPKNLISQLNEFIQLQNTTVKDNESSDLLLPFILKR